MSSTMPAGALPFLRRFRTWRVECAPGQQSARLLAPESGGGQVTALALSPDATTWPAATRPTVRVFKMATGALVVTLDGHKGAVESLAYRADGAELASGSRDTDVIVWDLVSQTGLFRLKGHKDAVTALAFLTPTTLASGSKERSSRSGTLRPALCADVCGPPQRVWSWL
ncbi:WD40 repeat, conserved site [Phytophthora cactorum]|nr:WD40 repeat, conserved site [Phytophthora cactorum]